MGFEVALGRDLRGPSLDILGPYRKFDLVLFSESHIVVVEVKAQQSYSSKELSRFKHEKCKLHNALKLKVTFVGICSAQYLNRKILDLAAGLDAVLTWKQIAENWSDKHFQRAEYVSGK